MAKNRITFGKWRNFALDDYEKQQLYYVVEANDIINKARHDLTARELKLMDFVISKIMPDDDKFHVIKTSMYELTKVLNIKQNGKNYADMAKTIGELRKKEVLIHDEEERTITQTGWVQSAKYHENGQVEIELSPNLAPHLLGLKNNYTQHLLLDTTKLKVDTLFCFINSCVSATETTANQLLSCKVLQMNLESG